jgi:DNA polymerase-3 subunit alpha
MVISGAQMSNVNKNQFTHLKIHTQYSICEGAVKIIDLKDFCKKNKIRAIGLSDTKNLCGALEFAEAISKAGTQPIIGSQINFKFKDHIGILPIIANNFEGYKSVITLSSKSYLENKSTGEPHCLIQELLKIKSGLTVLTGTFDGLIGNLFSKNLLIEIDDVLKLLKDAFGDKFYLEIQRHNDTGEKYFEKFLLKKSNEFEIPLIATHEVFYLDKDMHEAHDALICIGEKTYVNEKKRKKYSDEHYLKSSEQMIEIFSDLPEALENNFNFPFRCSYKSKTSLPILPNIKTSKNINADQELLNLASKGLKEKFNEYVFQLNFDQENKKNLEIYNKRLRHEFNIIKEMHYSGYFLIVSDYIKWARNNNIPVGPGRGSGAGSLIAWALSITDIDPIKFNLIFERFLNPDRISMPDFDIDFCEEKRDLVFSYLKKKYGNGVAHIITFGKLKARMAVRDIGRVLGLPYGFVDSISKMVPFDPSRPLDLQECINREPRIQDMISKDSRVKKLMDLSLKLEGLNRNIATHAAGVVIAEKNLSETVPLYKDFSSDLLLPATQFDMYSAEKAGLIKFDLLGLKTLTIINKTLTLLKEKNIDLDMNKINFEDKKVFELLSSAHTVGLFQLESSGMREALLQMKPNRLEDIIALVALYRPGPMSNISIYNDCKHKKKEPNYLHPKLKEILEPTYGVIIYQEQVMQIAQVLSGFTPGQADILRRAMGKKKRAVLEKQKQNFIYGAVKNGIQKDVADYIFKKIEPFAEYGFNKSHAAGYAVIAYQTAYLKTYYTKEFFAASMSMELGNHNKLSEFYEELKRLNIEVQRPCINRCFAEFKSTERKFYYALGAIKNVGFEAINQIVKEREINGQFKTLENFISRVDPKNINKLQLEGLVKAGAFDSLENNRKEFHDSIPNIILASKSAFENKINNQINLFNENNQAKKNTITHSVKKDWPFEEKLSKEFEAIGFFISDHPINEYKGVFDIYKIQNFNSFIISSTNETTLAATIMKIQEKKTKDGNPFAIIKFSDLGGVFELFLFSEILEKNRSILKEGKSFLITVIKDLNNQNNRFKRINIRNLVSLNEISSQSVPKIIFEIEKLENLRNLSNLISEEGNTNVKIIIRNNSKNLIFELSRKRKINPKILKSLKNEPYLKRINI